MNAIFATQGLGLRFHHRLAGALAPSLPIERRGFYVSDSLFQAAFRRAAPDFAAEPHVVAEWEILRDARVTSSDTEFLKAREREYAVGPLWDALVCDRRIMQGRWCKERQHYRPRFAHDELLRILTVALRRIEKWMDTVQPQVVFSFVPVTFGEYLIWMIAQSRRVPALYLYPTKIQNYMCWMDSFFGRPDVLTTEYEAYQAAGTRDQWVENAESYLRSVRGGTVRHEGMVAIPGTVESPDRGGPLGIARGLGRLARAEIEYWTGPARTDNHVNSPAASLFRQRVLLPARRRAIGRVLASQYVRQPDLAGLDFAFYPLHAEPEVALSIQGRPYQNQIETIRNLARSLPAGMVLLTKEHPRSIGYHSRGYYKKLLEIPNVRVADPFIESRYVVGQAALVASVWSFVGFEAVLQRKPLLSLGTPPFGILPEGMVRHVTDLNTLHAAVRNLLAQYEPDDRAVTHYVAACMKRSFPLDLYSEHLQKQGRFTAQAIDHRGAGGFDAFLAYTIERVRDVTDRAAAA